MRQWLRSHLTYANVMVTILAFIVLSGGTAVALSGTDTVQSDDLGPGSQVKAPDVATNAVNGSDVVDNSVTGADVNEFALGKVPNADKLDGIDSSRLEGARAYALTGGIYCPGNPVVFCSIPRGKRVAYVVKVAAGRYCVGVSGISAADPKSIAVSSALSNGLRFAYWRVSNVNCVDPEFEIYTGQEGSTPGSVVLHSNVEFTIVIP